MLEGRGSEHLEREAYSKTNLDAVCFIQYHPVKLNDMKRTVFPYNDHSIFLLIFTSPASLLLPVRSL